MDIKTYRKQATELADAMLGNYNTYKYRHEGNLWSFAFFWNGEKIADDRTTNLYRDFIPETFRLSEEAPVKPEWIIPRATSILGHYSVLAMVNRDLIERVYLRSIEEEGYKKIDEAMSIISDRTLLDEALNKFIKLKSEGNLDTKTDVIEFLLRWDVEKERIIKGQKPQGTYINLTTRLVYRYGENDIENGIFTLVNKDVGDRAKEFHTSATLINNPKIDGELVKLQSKYPSSNEVPLNKPSTARKVPIPGPRRVRVYGTSITLDWDAIAEDRRRRILSYQAFRLQEVLLSRIERILTERYLNLYKQPEIGPKATIEAIDAEIARSIGQEREVLIKVRKKFEMMGKFKDLDIKHRMPIIRIRQGE